MTFFEKLDPEELARLAMAAQGLGVALADYAKALTEAAAAQQTFIDVLNRQMERQRQHQALVDVLRRLEIRKGKGSEQDVSET